MLTQRSSGIAPHCLAGTVEVAGFAGNGEFTARWAFTLEGRLYVRFTANGISLGHLSDGVY